MGNKLATQGSPQLDYYLHDLPGAIVRTSEQTLNNSPFLKSMKCVHDEGPIIVKVYIIRSPNTDLKEYVKQLRNLRDTLQLKICKNVFPSRKFIITEKAGYIMRQYFSYNLHDRIGTRPFLSLVEKMWITFQCLKALDECNFYGISHGDIKSENIMLTSWNWVYLVDFATYKPTYIPEDGPSEFSFFFNNSGRRTCYLAPERFISGKDIIQGELTHSMDIFSLGCVFAEMFLDGIPRTIFSLAQLLSYRKNEYDPNIAIDRIECEPAKLLIKKMISMDAKERETSSYYLSEWSNMGFPSYFNDLHTYIYNLSNKEPDDKILSIYNDFDNLVLIIKGKTTLHDIEEQISNTDDDIDIIYDLNNLNNDKIFIPSDLPQDYINDYIEFATNLPTDDSSLLYTTDNFIVNIESQYNINDKITNNNNNNNINESDNINNNNTNTNKLDEKYIKSTLPKLNNNTNSLSLSSNNNKDDNNNYILEGMTIINSIVCSDLRHIQSPTIKVKALQLFENISKYLNDNIRLQRVIPYIISILHDTSAIVRSNGIRVLTNVLDMITTFPASDVHIFPEYIMPAIDHLHNDPEIIVRESFAKHLAKLAQISRRFLEASQVLLQEQQFSSSSNIKSFSNYDTALQEIHSIFTSVFSSMFWKDCPSCVKRAVLEDITRLAMFFGKKRTSDFLLPLLVTFLNENDWELRCSFFQNIVGLCEYVGGQSLESYIYPCILQALSDKEEFVIDKAVNCLTSITEKNLFRKQTLFDIIRKLSPLLLHPNIWIRNSVINAFVCISNKLDIVDRFTFMNDLINPFLISEIIDINEIKLQETLYPPLSRSLYEISIHICNKALQKWASSPHEKKIKNRQSSGYILIPNKPPHPYDPNDSFIKIFINTLKENDIKDNDIDIILKISSYIKEVARHIVSSESHSNMNLFVTEDHIGIREHSVNPPDDDDTRTIEETINSNKDWFYLTHFRIEKKQTAFIIKEEPYKVNSKQKKRKTLMNSTSSSNSNSNSNEHSSTNINNGSNGNNGNNNNNGNNGNNNDDYIILSPTASTQLEQLSLLKTPPKLPEFGKLKKMDPSLPLPLRGDSLKKWKPSGILIGHLTEHKQSVNSLCISSDNQFFSSCSSDGCVKIWDCSRLEKKVTNRSRLTYDSKSGKLFSMCMIENSHSIACGSENGNISIIRIDTEVPRKDYVEYKKFTSLDRSFNVSGCVTSLKHYNKGLLDSLVVGATSTSIIHGFDLRMKKEAFYMDNSSKAGSITSMIIDPTKYWLLTGTVRGCYTCWDLRFNIPVATWWQPGQDNEIYKLEYRQGTTFFSSIGNGEINLWDINNQERKAIFQISDKHHDPRSSINLINDYNIKGEPPNPKTQSEKLKNISIQTHTHRALTYSPGGYLLTGSADKNIRYWQLSNISKSCVLSGLNPNQLQPKYYSERRENIEIYQESPPSRGNTITPIIKRQIVPSTNHHDSILDIILGEFPLPMMISSSRDGVIKVWK